MSVDESRPISTQLKHIHTENILLGIQRAFLPHHQKNNQHCTITMVVVVVVQYLWQHPDNVTQGRLLTPTKLEVYKLQTRLLSTG